MTLNWSFSFQKIVIEISNTFIMLILCMQVTCFSCLADEDEDEDDEEDFEDDDEWDDWSYIIIYIFFKVNDILNTAFCLWIL